MRIEKSSDSSRICRNGGFVSRTNSISKEIVVKRRQCQDGGFFNAIFFFIFSYGQIMKNLKILLSSRKQKGNAIIRRFVIPVMFNNRLMFLLLLFIG